MMMKNMSKYAVLSCNDHNELDKKTIKKSISGYELMKNAGKNIFEIIEKNFNKKKNIKILCGPGNNGGDAFVVAKLLRQKGFYNINLFSLVAQKDLKGDVKQAAIESKLPLINFKNFKISKNDLIIDGIFGSGLKRNITGNIKKIIENINLKKPYCISIDVPSGINGDTGEIMGVSIKANETITFTRKKPGHLLNPGSEYCGKIHVTNIGIDLKNLNFKNYIFENHPYLWIKNFPWPNKNSHKYKRGFTLIICGEKMTGASRLAARGAARIGCGLLCLGVPKKTFDIYSIENPIALIEIINNENDLKVLLKNKKINTILIGPGLGVSKEKLKLILRIIKEKERIVILDADALKNNFNKIISKKKTNVIITPHEGEFKSLLKETKLKNHKKNKLRVVSKFVKKTKMNLIFKGNKTIICSKDGRLAINTNSSPFLATGGTGDVLAGMVSGLVAQGMQIFEASCASVWIHGEIAKIKGPGLIAEDLPEMIPNILKKLKNYS